MLLAWNTTERLCFRDGTAIEANRTHYNIKESQIQPPLQPVTWGGSLVWPSPSWGPMAPYGKWWAR